MECINPELWVCRKCLGEMDKEKRAKLLAKGNAKLVGDAHTRKVLGRAGPILLGLAAAAGVMVWVYFTFIAPLFAPKPHDLAFPKMYATVAVEIPGKTGPLVHTATAILLKFDKGVFALAPSMGASVGAGSQQLVPIKELRKMKWNLASGPKPEQKFGAPRVVGNQNADADEDLWMFDTGLADPRLVGLESVEVDKQPCKEKDQLYFVPPVVGTGAFTPCKVDAIIKGGRELSLKCASLVDSDHLRGGAVMSKSGRLAAVVTGAGEAVDKTGHVLFLTAVSPLVIPEARAGAK